MYKQKRTKYLHCLTSRSRAHFHAREENTSGKESVRLGTTSGDFIERCGDFLALPAPTGGVRVWEPVSRARDV